VQQFAFAIIILLFFRSSKSYFWLVLFFMLLDAPGGMFTPNESGIAPTLPLFPFILGIRDINFAEVFILAMIGKAIYYKREKLNLVFQFQYLLLLAYLIFLIITSFSFSLDLMKLFRSIREILPYTMLISIPLLLKKENDYISFFFLLFPFCFFVFFCQIYELALNQKFVTLFGVNIEMLTDGKDGLVRAINSGSAIFTMLYGSMFFLLLKKKVFNQIYLLVLLVLCTISIFFGGTRGWEIAIGLMLFLFFLIRAKNPSKMASGILIPLTLIILLYAYIPVIQKQIDRSWEKLTTVQKLVEGDDTADGTLSRIDERGPRVMKKFSESPIIGFGFSDDYWHYADQHVGNHNLLLNAGILGFLIFAFFWVYFIRKILKTYFSLSHGNNYKQSILIFVIGFLGIFIIHSSSMQMFTYTVGYFYRGFFIVFFFSMADFYLKESMKNEESFIQIMK